MKKIYVFLAEGFEEIEAIAIIDTLRRAELDVTTVSITGDKQVTGAQQITIIADQLFDSSDFSDADMLVLPGGMPGTTHLNQCEPLKELILTFVQREGDIAAICAAPLILGGLGLLQGEKATCYPGFESYLTGAELSEERVVVSNRLITGRGPGAAIEFALAIVKKYGTEETAAALKEGMIVR